MQECTVSASPAAVQCVSPISQRHDYGALQETSCKHGYLVCIQLNEFSSCALSMHVHMWSWHAVHDHHEPGLSGLQVHKHVQAIETCLHVYQMGDEHQEFRFTAFLSKS